MILISHTTDGVAIAKKYRLPQQIQDVIRCHHGDTMTAYFYGKACKIAQTQQNGSVHEADFRYPGPRPLSEPETRAMAALAVRAAPDVMVTLHAQGEEIYWEFGGIAVPGAEALGREMAARSGYRLAAVPPESAYAGYKDWFIQEFRRPAYTVECGRGRNPLPFSQFPAIYARVRPILEAALCAPL